MYALPLGSYVSRRSRVSFMSSLMALTTSGVKVRLNTQPNKTLRLGGFTDRSVLGRLGVQVKDHVRLGTESDWHVSKPRIALVRLGSTSGKPIGNLQ
ncbi:hypothetical protein RSAG8_12376, partial [Rhizoctonia solani AG-8 WAC10335]